MSSDELEYCPVFLSKLNLQTMAIYNIFIFADCKLRSAFSYVISGLAQWNLNRIRPSFTQSGLVLPRVLHVENPERFTLSREPVNPGTKANINADQTVTINRS